MNTKTNGYPFYLPWLFVLLVLGFCGSLVAAFGTGDWRYLLGAVACWFIIARNRAKVIRRT